MKHAGGVAVDDNIEQRALFRQQQDLHYFNGSLITYNQFLVNFQMLKTKRSSTCRFYFVYAQTFVVVAW